MFSSASFSVLGFLPKENTSGVLQKKYADGYVISIDLGKKAIDYGEKIKAESKTTQNFSQPENYVVLECVNRLLEKGYKPENIVLEKTYPSGHGTSGRLDICVNRDDGSEYLLVECKTYGKEFDKEFTRMKKDGGQLFTYFKFSNKADVIMLYACELKGKEIVYCNEIVKIEDDYRTGDVKDFYEKWNKLTKDNGVFEAWVKPYNFESKVLTPKQLIPIKEEDSSLIFNQFLEILRHNVVSDKPNAFNKIFTLFLCKVYDEKTTKPNEELQFQWFDGIDKTTGENAYVDFLIRLSDLYKNGMLEFLEKEVTDFSEEAFNKKYGILDDGIKNDLLKEFKKIRLEKNNEFAIKEVFDNQSFLENSKIIKEVVELLQGYRIRYNKRQQYLSDFFELLLTTGLKQESGQFFTPVPIAQFIIKSLPIDRIVNEKLEKGEKNNLLPYLIDYAAGSGHFLTESMHEIQGLLDGKKPENYINDTANKIKTWHTDHFDWATQYIYGIEKDYRLVKVGKVGCYLHGDGLANVILSDGLANFDHPDYKLKLKNRNSDFPKENKQFDILVSNPPYSISAFKNTSTEYYSAKDFDIYNLLTTNSSEIECLFVERTKQLLKDGGVAGIILPSSILSNEGIYTKAREIILQNFEIIAITELGSNTFMATGTNTVVLFLRRINNYRSINLRKSMERFFDDFQDVTRNGIEKPVAKYINHVWENISFDDYVFLLKKEPKDNVVNHEIYKEYRKKLKAKTEKDFWNVLLDTEKEKLLYFILAYPQKVVLVKTGEKDAEKRFLGYEFSNRRGSEGIHSIQRGKSISECTKLFDDRCFDNPEKASTYIYKAFSNNYEFPIHEILKNNIFRVDLVDMLTFDRAGFAKNISTAVKKKLKIESKWDSKKLSEILSVLESGKRPQGGVSEYLIGIPSLGGEHINLNGTVSIENMKFVPENYFNQAKQGILNDLDILICKDGALTGKTALFKKERFLFDKGMINEHIFILRTNEICLQQYLFHILFSSQGQELLKLNITGAAQGGLNRENLLNIQIPLPPKEIQEKIVSEIEVLEKKEAEAKEKIEKLKLTIIDILPKNNFVLLGEISDIAKGTSITKDMTIEGDVPVVAGGKEPAYFHNISNRNKNVITVSASGANAGFINYYKQPIFASDCNTVISKDEKIISTKLIYHLLKSMQNQIYGLQRGQAQPHVYADDLAKTSVPLPTPSEQQKIVSEIEKLETQISELEQQLSAIPQEKTTALRKYL